jgi:hypothetical protein
MKTKLFFAAVSAMMLAACSNDDNYVAYEGPVEAQFTAGISSAKTRSDSYDKWTENQEIGVIVTKVGDSEDISNTNMSAYTNVKYKASTLSNDQTSAAFTASSDDDKIYFKGSYSVNFAAYSPYSTATDLTKIPISGTDANYDYIYASATGATYSNKEVKFAFSHVMSKLTIKVDKSDEVTADITKVEIGKLYTSGTFNAKAGTTATSGTATSLNYSTDLTSAHSYYLVPQTLSSVTVTVTAGNTYTYTISSLAMKAGNEYTYNLTAKNNELVLTGSTITAYTSNAAVSGNATM